MDDKLKAIKKQIKDFYKDNKICPVCGHPFTEVPDPATGKKTGYLFRCERCTPKDRIMSIG
jgi:hypothetical protein